MGYPFPQVEGVPTVDIPPTPPMAPYPSYPPEAPFPADPPPPGY